MCMEDVRLGRETKPSQNVVVVPNTSVPFIPGNKNRRVLIISRPLANVVTLSLKDPATVDNGIHLHIGGNPLVLTLDTHGLIVTLPMSAIAAAGTETLGYWESELLKE